MREKYEYSFFEFIDNRNISRMRIVGADRIENARKRTIAAGKPTGADSGARHDARYDAERGAD